MRGKKKGEDYEKGAYEISKRNERERIRAFMSLQRHLPSIRSRSKRVSKLRILKTAINYIQSLQEILQNRIQENKIDSVSNGRTVHSGYMLIHTLIIAFLISFCCAADDPRPLAPTPKRCLAFKKFLAQYNPEKITEWITTNCDKIHPRPEYITCNQILQFARGCGLDNDESTNGWQFDQLSKETTTVQPTLPPTLIQPEILPHYLHINRQTAYDNMMYGNWYYPNYYPTTHINTFMTPSEKDMQYRQEWKWTQGGDYPYHRANNLVNIALQQTIVPTCLHDLPLCVRLLALSYRNAEAQAYYNYLSRQKQN
uniref:BHLH domain-containing protein n=1 Tax=Syphacia muris TaxID=451379 RepID=A0A0N5APW1_9BILA